MPKRKLPPDEKLKELYDSGMSAREIAEVLEANVNTVASALRRAGISNRTAKETKQLQKERGIIHEPSRYWLGKKQPPEMVEKRVSKIRGPNHYMWKGGDHRRHYRDVIDKDECSKCSGVDNLGIHHIDFDHYNNEPDNLEVLCVSCHMSLHKKAYWDAIHAGEEPQKSNGPVGWRKEVAP